MRSFISRSIVRQYALGLSLTFGALLTSYSSVSAFDTFWHSAASAAAGQHYGFSADAVNILQFGTFGPDFFGPLYDAVLGERMEKLQDFMGFRDSPKMAPVRKSGIFMHFDNLYGKVDRNWKFDYIWTRLLQNTASAISGYYGDGSLNEGTKKILILVTLGCSLHMLEDFYSHSDWIHFDFVKMGFPQEKAPWGKDYAPSWFQVRAKLGPPNIEGTKENWPFHVFSGIYPPRGAGESYPMTTLGVPMSHTNMNHDNSQLFYEEETQVAYHKYGAHPATDDASAAEHQLFAVNSAAMAAIEWIGLLEEKSEVKAAIDYAKGWDLKAYNPAMLHDLEDGLHAILLLSCVKHKWDGDKPPKSREAQCNAVNMVASVKIPTVFNEFWGCYVKHNILEHLTQGIGDQSGKYTFDADWLKSQR